MHKILLDLKNSHYGKSIVKLAGGTAVAQFVLVLISPLLTRVYGPTDFNVLAIYVAVISILSGIVCFRYEIAIALPEHDEDAMSILMLSLIISLLFSAIIALLLWLFSNKIIQALRIEDLSDYFWMIPLGVLLSGISNSIQNWTLRKQRFGLLARVKISRSISIGAVQLGTSFLVPGAFGLLFGHMMSAGSGSIAFARATIINDKQALKFVSFKSVIKQAKAYVRFPKYSVVESLTNTMSSQVPIILIASWAAGPEAGYLMLMFRVLQAPIALVGGSISQVYLSHASENYRSGNLAEFTERNIENLLKLLAGPLLFICMLAPVLFPLIFGLAWEKAGYLALWMAPWLIFQLISSPISMVMHVVGRQKEMTLLVVFGFILKLSALYLAHVFIIEHISEVFILTNAVFYISCYFVFSHFAGCKVHKAFLLLGRCAKHAGLWIIFGLILNLIWMKLINV